MTEPLDILLAGASGLAGMLVAWFAFRRQSAEVRLAAGAMIGALAVTVLHDLRHDQLSVQGLLPNAIVLATLGMVFVLIVRGIGRWRRSEN